MTDWVISNMETVVEYAPVWGYLIIFLLMTIESSFIPFPSEVVMIPAGFLACRGELTCHVVWLDLGISLVVGLLGSLAGAYINYWLAVRLGRPILYRYGRYVMLSERTLARAEEIFKRYGEMTTFVCRMLPAIRQLISLPAGLCRMPLGRFTLFTALGAGGWCVVLLAAGWWLGRISGDIGYPELVIRGKALIEEHYGMLIGALALFCACYLGVQHWIMNGKNNASGN